MAEPAKVYIPTGYADTPLLPFLGATIVVGMPLVYFKNTGQTEWVGKYTFLILLMLVVFYWKPINRFRGFAQAYMNGKQPAPF